MGMQYWNLYINESDKTNASGNSDDYGAYGELAVLLSHYVKKEKGKGLSSNDFTDSEKTKLESIEEGANVNKIESISVNDEPQFIDQCKNVNLCFPTKLSEFENDVPYAVNIESSKCSDYSDSYVGKAKTAFEQEQTLCIGKNANASSLGIAIGNSSQSRANSVAIGNCAKANCRNGDIAIGNNVCTCGNYTINIGDKLKYNTTNSIWEGKVTNASCADVATKNANGTNLTLLDTLNEGLENEICQRWYFDNCLSDRIDCVVSKMVCVYDVCNNHAYPLALCTSTQTIGKSCECSLTFNACCGVLCSPIICGQICGYVCSENDSVCNVIASYSVDGMVCNRICSCSCCGQACNILNSISCCYIACNIINSISCCCQATNLICSCSCNFNTMNKLDSRSNGGITSNCLYSCSSIEAQNLIFSIGPSPSSFNKLSVCCVSNDASKHYDITQFYNQITFYYCDRVNNCSTSHYVCYDGTTSFTSKDTVCFNGCTYSQACTNIRNGLATCTDLNSVSNRVGTIESYIPNQTSTTNQLADKSFVNSSIQTASSNFRGNYSTWANVPTSVNDYPTDYAGSKTPTTNDYLVVEDASDYRVENPLLGTWRFKYSGKWSVDGKNGWLPEYQVNEEPFTSEQLYAINSGITCDKVTAYDNHLSNTSNPHNVTKTQVGLGNVDNTKDSDKSVNNSTCFNGCTYAQVCTNIRSGLTSCVGTVTSINIYCGTTCKCGITSSGDICLGSNAFNSTAFTTCKGTVTSVNVSVNGKSGTAVTSSGTVTITDVGVKHTQVCSSADRKILFASADIATNCYCGVYFSDGTNGCPFTYNPNNGELKVPKVTIGKGCATMQYNSTTQAIEFVFA